MGKVDCMSAGARIGIACLMVSVACHAGWRDKVGDTPYQCWPSWRFQKLGDMQDWQLRHAIMERAWAAEQEDAIQDMGETIYFVGPKFPKSEVENLTLFKRVLKVLYPLYVDVDHIYGHVESADFDMIDDYLNNVVGHQMNLVTNVTTDEPQCRLPRYSAETIAAHLKIPTNYHDHSFAKTTKGVAPTIFMDNATMGWTNAVTEAGGTNFPAGRTYWTTADYGKQHIPVILNRLFLRQSDKRQYIGEPLSDVVGEFGGAWVASMGDSYPTNAVEGIGVASDGDWDVAKSIAATNMTHFPNGGLSWGGSYRPFHMYGGRLYVTTNDPPYSIEAQWETARFKWSLPIDGNTNTPMFDWSLMVFYGESVDTAWALIPSNTVFDSNSNPYVTTTNNWSHWIGGGGVVLSNESWGQQEVLSTNFFGPHVLDIPTACAEPTTNMQTTSRGWDLYNTGDVHSNGHRVVVLMDFRKGFTYTNYAFDADTSNWW